MKTKFVFACDRSSLNRIIDCGHGTLGAHGAIFAGARAPAKLNGPFLNITRKICHFRFALHFYQGKKLRQTRSKKYYTKPIGRFNGHTDLTRVPNEVKDKRTILTLNCLDSDIKWFQIDWSCVRCMWVHTQISCQARKVTDHISKHVLTASCNSSTNPSQPIARMRIEIKTENFVKRFQIAEREKKKSKKPVAWLISVRKFMILISPNQE